MKINLLPVIFFFPLLGYAQVGINTVMPSATLDVIAKDPTGTTTNVDGMLIPRVDRQRAQSMTGVPTSTLVYVNSIATGTQAGTAVNIDAVGYYYYNGSNWVKISPPLNIYNTNGTLTGNRTVTQGANTLAFASGIVNGFSVANSTLSVDGANGRIGIGSNAPTKKLHVEGSQFLNAAATVAATNDAFDINIGQDGFSYGNRIDNFGINMRTASTADPGSVARINFGDVSTGTISGLGNRYLSFSVGKPLNELMYLTNINSGAVGIRTITPQKSLHVNGSLQVVNEINVGGSATAAGSAGTTGQVLTSSGAGAAPSWQSLNTVSGTIASANYVQGTTALTVASGTTADVPGVTITLTVPAGKTQTFLFTVLGYATQFPNGITSQGTFNLLQNNVKISSAYAAKYGPAGGGGLQDIPIPVTFLKSVTLPAGTYTFKIQYSAWSGSATVNVDPNTYAGYNGDTEAMLTKMQVLVYNN
ncbi:hypothetical protein SAMN05444360_10732 [Chryseobacterium carnipullorum]|uniref:hypothetical protein n=1 Tax=Chryseobacterium carnipullorum TaxID=1124835 RepID=UPI0009139837|nr:hypothetical protein [Chryseobacterium carnipullorum]SHM02112.1 hypothetical protein SAMN05444360_10732 [Chryseobacterium carnipullorum]